MLSRSDLDGLSAEYTVDELDADHLVRVASRLNVSTPETNKLAASVLADLDPTSGGLSWWSKPPKCEAILIADHTYQAAGAPLGLLLEARLHLSALERVWSEQEGRWVQAAQRDGRLTIPGSDSPMDDILTAEGSLHLSGFFRCVAQVLDCVAACTIAVLDLPTNLPKAAWPVALSPKQLDRMGADRAEATAELIASTTAAVEGAGPEGWAQWAVSMRHLLVHRPRVIGLNTVYRAGDGLHLSGAKHASDLRICCYLPRQPQRSWIESMLPDGPARAVLEEHAGLTLGRLLLSTTKATEAVSAILAARWVERRNAEVDQLNWRIQWPEKLPALLSFQGYAPGARPLTGDRLVLSPTDSRRIAAAQLEDSVRESVWGAASEAMNH